MIEVVSAVMVREGRILLTQRRSEKDYPFTWECPGGKVDGDESHHEAIRRELMEEIGVHIPNEKISETSLFCREFKSTSSPPSVFVLFYVVSEWWMDPKPREGQGLGWFTAEEMLRLPLTPGNAAAASSILRVMGVRVLQRETSSVLLQYDNEPGPYGGPMRRWVQTAG